MQETIQGSVDKNEQDIEKGKRVVSCGEYSTLMN